MTQSLPPFSTARRKSSAPAPEPRWISNGSTLNPSPGPLLKERRDTADGCRDRATADLLEAVTMATAHSRRMLERSAASWSKRAELLQGMEARIDCRLNPFDLTDAELAEDAAHVRL